MDIVISQTIPGLPVAEVLIVQEPPERTASQVRGSLGLVPHVGEWEAVYQEAYASRYLTI